MKKIFLFLLLFILTKNQILFSQFQKKIGDVLKSRFENFEYENIISITDSILNSNSILSSEDSIHIFYFRSLAAFHLWDINLSEENFKSLLRIDKDFILDSTEVSPKIISFFNQIKRKEFDKSLQSNESNISSDITAFNKEYIRKNFLLYKEAMWKNLLLPGWGNLVMNEKSKGYILISSYSLLALSSVYFYFDTFSKEKIYLSEINPDKISEKYQSYNKSYKLRNISLITLAIVYLYSQIDLLSKNPYQKNVYASGFKIRFQHSDLIQIAFRLQI